MSKEKRIHKRFKSILDGFLTIHGFKNSEIRTKYVPVTLEDISLGGLSFESHLNFPLDNDLFLKFENSLFGNMIGYIAWKRKTNENFQYGVQFLSVPNALYQFLAIHENRKKVKQLQM